MANLITIEPIRYAQSILSTALCGLLQTKPDMGLSCTGLVSVDGFEIRGVQPAGTDRRMVFQVDGAWHRVKTDGMLQMLDASIISAESILEEGNTVAELLALTSVPGLLNKVVGVAIALYAEDRDSSMPTIGIGIRGTTAEPVTAKVETSPFYDFAPETLLISLEAKVEQENGGSVLVEARVIKPDGSTSEWAHLAAFAGTKANGIQFRATYAASQVGTSIAKVERVAVQYRSGDDILSGVGTATLISTTHDWHDKVRDCRITIYHAPLEDARMKAYCAIRPKTSVAKGEQVGFGTGERKTYQLAHVSGVAFDTVAVYFDSIRQMSGYELNTEVGRITCTAPLGAVITADYVYGWTREEWQEMPVAGVVRTPNDDRTECKILLPEAGEDKSICAVRMDLETTEGSSEGEALGVGTGRAHTYTLEHAVKEGEISLFANGAEISSENWALREGNKSITIAAPVGFQITANYKWISETPQVRKFVSVFR